MIKEIFFYRNFYTEEFESFDTGKNIVPVRKKNPFCPQSMWFDSNIGEWEPLADESDISFLNAHPVEYADFPTKPNDNYILGDGIIFDFGKSLDIEDMSTKEMAFYLKKRGDIKKWRFDEKNYKDKNDVPKDFFEFLVQSESDSLVLTITCRRFVHNKDTGDTPCIEDSKIFFDMRQGTFGYSGWKGVNETLDEKIDEDILSREYYTDYNLYLGKSIRKPVTQAIRFKDIVYAINILEKSVHLPRPVLQASYRELVLLVQKLTGISSVQSLMDAAPGTEILETMYTLTRLPFEPKLCYVIYNENMAERKIRFRPDRLDSEAYNKFCKKLRIKNYRTLKKCYIARPVSLFTYLRIRDCGFTDINLYNRILTNENATDLFDNTDKNALIKFCEYSIKKRGELCTVNTLLKSKENDFTEKIDTIEMFARYFDYMPETLKNDILINGLSNFNHDALSNIAYKAENRNIVFNHTEEERKLEDSIQGYDFRLPKDSYQLCSIGTALHNCVASYANSVSKKKCTIVYATYNGELRLCIEVRNKQIIQERCDHNGRPNRDELAILSEWHFRHGLA